MTGSEIRKRFLDFFAERGHQVVSSSSLVPHNDPTLLFTNAGMNQFKDCFLGKEKRSYVRAVSSQKCVRAGGKHNDLENVGRTARHHTFFEMLGNFSFGDYFKKEAIAFAWEFLTEDLKLDKNRLYVTVYTDDDEAADIWHEQEGIPRERIFRFEEDNFWAMGDTGPCGPCSEIFWDNGPELGCDNPDCNVGCECDRYMEIWNNVFMQFDRSQDGTLTPLPKPAVDTGMGLERITTVMQKVKSNYATDLIRSIIAHIETLAGKAYGADEEADVSMQVMADHSRAMAFLIADGVMPSNEGRGYVLRRIMRRAMRHARMIGFEDPILYNTASFVLDSMSEAYPEEAQRKDFVAKVVKNEEERFMLTLDNGLKILQDEVASLKAEGKNVIPGPVLFKLYDTFGFPTDLTADIIEKDGFSVDEDGFNVCMDEQRRNARAHWKGSGEEAVSGLYHKLSEEGLRSDFTGYQSTEGSGEIIALIHNEERVNEVSVGADVEIITSASPFYGESGGQVGDCGQIEAAGVRVEVTGTKRPLPDLIVHTGKVVEGTLTLGLAVTMRVDSEARGATELNHTATHILQSVLIDVLGDHVKQAGSLVTPERLRFDFTHFSPVTSEEILSIEDKVNRYIRGNGAVATNEMAHDEAVAAGATALFGEKYGDRVRVVGIGDFSMELCGGTHANAAGDIGLFRIVSEAGIAAGIRRIEAVTGAKALEYVQAQQQSLDRLAGIVKTDRSQVEGRIAKILERQRELEREVEKLQSEVNKGKSSDLLASVVDVKGVSLLATEVEGVGGKELRDFADKLRDSMGSGVIVLGCREEGRVNLLVAVTKDLTDKLKAGAIIADLAVTVGGKGGGRPDLAQAGGKNPEALPEALQRAAAVVGDML